METFGIPVVVIVMALMWACSSYADQQRRENEQIAERWDAITIGMGVKDVFQILGRPNWVVKMGAEEAWGYGPDKSDGEILFVEGRVVGYQRPSCTVNVSAGQSAEADTADVRDGQSAEKNAADTSDGEPS